MNESCHICEWVMSHIWTSRDTHMNEACQGVIHDQVTSHHNAQSCVIVQGVLRVLSRCCSVLQCVAVCCNVLQCVAVCCSVLQCVAVCCSVLQCVAVCCSVLQYVAGCCSVLQCVAVCCITVSIENESRDVPWHVSHYHTLIPHHSTMTTIHLSYRYHIWMSHVPHIWMKCLAHTNGTSLEFEIFRWLVELVICIQLGKHCHDEPHGALPRYNTLQHSATHCNTLQHTTAWVTRRIIRLQHAATHGNILQHTAAHCSTLQHTAAHCNTLQHAAAHCNRLQHTATHYNTTRHQAAAHCNTQQHTAAHCTTLHHTATHCNTLQHPHERRVTSRTWMRHVANLNALCHTKINVSHSFQSESIFVLWSNAIKRSAVLSHVTCHVAHINALSHKYGQSSCAWNSVLQCVAVCCSVQHTATHCNTLQHTATHCNTVQHTGLFIHPNHLKSHIGMSYVTHINGVTSPI